jgi:prophage maintenance system killer protein
LDKYEALPKTNEEEKLIAIATLCQDLDQMHVFVDGNIRTTGILVLNKLLLQQRLSPSVLEDVNCLDCLSVAEIVEKIREGQAYFQALLA